MTKRQTSTMNYRNVKHRGFTEIISWIRVSKESANANASGMTKPKISLFICKRKERARLTKWKKLWHENQKGKKWLSQYFYIPMMNGPGVEKTTYQTNYGNEKSLNIATVLNNCHKETYIICIFYCLLVVSWVWNWMGWNFLIENKFLFI